MKNRRRNFVRRLSRGEKGSGNRGEIHDRVAAFLNPEQLGKWDKEVAKAKEFLGQRLDS
jgi:hypothetical protein